MMKRRFTIFALGALLGVISAAGFIAVSANAELSAGQKRVLKSEILGANNAVDQIVGAVGYQATLTTNFQGVTASLCKDSGAVTVTGASAGDKCSVTPNATAGALNLGFTCYVSASNAVKIHVCNPTVSAITGMASGAYYIDVKDNTF